MTYEADEPAISGTTYTVIDIDGHPPTSLTDFTYDAALTLLKDGRTRRVVGSGAPAPDSVRFHQKDSGPDGKDVRVWSITVRGDLFLAEPVAAASPLPPPDRSRGRPDRSTWIEPGHFPRASRPRRREPQ